LYAVDLFLKTANPDKARAKAKVFSVDAPRARRYTPKPSVYTANATTDIIVKAGATKIGEVTLDLDTIDATFLVSEVGWTPSLTIKSYSGMNSKDLGAVSADVDTLASTINLNVGYNDANTVLGRVDPGSWSLYATHTNNSVVLITSGNLKISTTL
jgi:hypothetical protein